MKKPTAEPVAKKPGWINKKTVAASSGVTGPGFDTWGVEPVGRIGRETFFTIADIVKNRVDYSLGKERAKINKTAAATPPRSAQLLDLTEERARLTFNQANKTELEVAKISGELLAAPVVELFVTRMIANARARLLAIPTKAAPEVVTLTTANEVKEILTELIYEAIAELKHYRVDDYIAGPDTDESGEPDSGSLGAAAKPNRKRVGRPKAKAKRGK